VKRILVICYSPLHRDPRVLRQIKALEGFDIATAGYTAPQSGIIEFVRLNEEGTKTFFKKIFNAISTLFGFVTHTYWTVSKVSDFNRLIKGGKTDWIIANDLEALPIGLKVAEHYHAKIVFDAHEYFPGYLQKKDLRSLLRRVKILRLCKKYLNKPDYFTVVSPGIQKLYKNNFGINSYLITNATSFQNLAPQSVKKNKINLVHHGIAAPARRIELMIQMMDKLRKEFVLHLYLMQTEDYKAYWVELNKLASKYPSRVFFHDTVATNFIPEEINKYDIGVFLLPPTNINYKFALPNKFFEFVQARLAIAIGPSVDMKVFVDRYQLGVVTKDFSIESFSRALNSLSIEEIMKFKMNANVAAPELCAEENMKYYRELILNN